MTLHHSVRDTTGAVHDRSETNRCQSHVSEDTYLPTDVWTPLPSPLVFGSSHKPQLPEPWSASMTLSYVFRAYLMPPKLVCARKIIPWKIIPLGEVIRTTYTIFMPPKFCTGGNQNFRIVLPPDIGYGRYNYPRNMWPGEK